MAFNVKKGWPFAHPFEHSGAPKVGEAIVAGMAIKRDANGELVKAAGAAKEVSFMALNNQSDFSVQEANSLPFLIGNAVVMTDQYAVDVYAPGDELIVDSANPGKLKKRGLDVVAPTWGWVDAVEDHDGIEMLVIIKPAPMGKAS